MDNNEIKSELDSVVEDTDNIDEKESQEANESEEPIANDGEKNGEIVPVFEREDWEDKVVAFGEKYPIASELVDRIGDVILEDDNLWSDENCLEKALLKVLSENYVNDESRATSEDFLEKYIYNNEAIRNKIVDEYLESIEAQKLPSAMTKGGKISLAAPRRPKSIKEAGALVHKIMGE